MKDHTPTLMVIMLRRRLSSNKSTESSTRNKKPSYFSSLFGSSFWSELRQKAALVITSSLTEAERQAVLTKYNPPSSSSSSSLSSSSLLSSKPSDAAQVDDENEESNKETKTKTISEAVAEARAEEAALQAEKFEKQMNRVRIKIEQAAKARAEQDLILERRKLRFEQWQADLQRAKQQAQTQSTTSSSTTTITTPTTTTIDVYETSDASAGSSMEEEIQPVKTDTNDSEKKEEQEQNHPILGPALVDFGSRRVHLVHARDLIQLRIWKRQRTFRFGRVEVMAKDKEKTLHLGIPGIITLFQDTKGNLFIVDGQHRVGMMQLLLEKNVNIDLSKILVEVYTDSAHKDTSVDLVQDLFVEINKAQPVKSIDLPGVAKGNDRDILEGASQQLRRTYPEMFSTSQNCHVPHLNIDNLRNDLFDANILERHSIRSANALYDWLLEKNQAMAQKYRHDNLNDNGRCSSSGSSGRTLRQRALEKARRFDFYLGLGSDWMQE